MDSPTEELRARLDELGVEHDTYDLPNGERGVSWIDGNNIEWEAVQRGENFEIHALQLVTPEQAIAATVGNVQEPSDAVIERIGRFCTDYAQCLVDSTILGKRNHEFVDRRAAERAEVVEADLIRELAEDIATMGRSCASCPEMDNPDSYIAHLQSALRWHDEHVPRPTNPRNTCVVLMGEKPPEEVLFVREDGGVTHYLPEGAGTCQNNGFVDDGGWYFVCSKCGCEFEYADFACEFTEGYGLGSPKFCPNCGRKVG